MPNQVPRGRPQARRSPWPVIAGALAAAALAAVVLFEVVRVLRLEAAVREVHGMDVAQLERAFEDSPFGRDRHFLGAIARNQAARAYLLGRIAALRDPDLYEPMGSPWDVMGWNREGISVMRRVAGHPNADAATLGRLASGPDARRVVHELLANPNTPLAVLEPYFASSDELVERGLARNPKTPQRVLERLADSPARNTRLSLIDNKSTPREFLDRLAKDADDGVARSARQAIERRR